MVGTNDETGDLDLREIMTEDGKAYDNAMLAAIVPELLPLLEKQTHRFQQAALPFCEDDKEPAWLHAFDCAGARLDDLVRLARRTVYHGLEDTFPVVGFIREPEAEPESD